MRTAAWILAVCAASLVGTSAAAQEGEMKTGFINKVHKGKDGDSKNSTSSDSKGNDSKGNGAATLIGSSLLGVVAAMLAL